MPAELNEERLGQIVVKINGSDLPVAVMDQLIEAVIDSSLAIPDMVVMNFHDDDLALVDGSAFPLGGSIEIELSDNDNPRQTQVIFKGEITAIEPAFEDGTLATLTVRGYSKSHRMHRETKTKAWLNVTDSDIAAQIASANGLSSQAQSTSEVFKHVFQNALTDMAFLQQRAERIGFEVFVQDDKLYFRKPDPAGSATELEWGVQLRTFQPRLTVSDQVNEVTVKGWDPKTKREIVGQATSSPTAPQIGLGKWGGQAAQSAIASAKKIEVRRPVQSQADADTVAKAILNEINSGFIEAQGEARGVPTLKAGMLVKLTKLGAKFSGAYKVTSVRHVYSLDGIITYFTVEGTRPSLLAELLVAPMREEPRWHGVVPAIVTNNNSSETDWGMVKIKYPWLDTAQESFWARVAGPGFGANRGIYFLPEVNDEVLVAFEHGDFNRPYIIGGLYNGNDAPAAAVGQVVASGKVKTRIIRTRSGHTIRFVDKEGAEDYIEIVDASGNTSIKMDTQAKKITVSSKDQIEITSVGNMSLKAQGQIDIQATRGLSLQGQTVDVKGMSSATIEASAGAMTLKGMTLSAQGNTTAEVKGGAMLNLQAGLVKIN